MKHTLFSKYFFRTILLLLVSVVLMGGVFAGWSYRYVQSERRKNMESIADETLRIYTAFADNWEGSDFFSDITTSILSNGSDCDIMVANRDGVITSCSDGIACRHIGLQISADILDEISAGKNGIFNKNTDLCGVFEHVKYTVAQRASDAQDNSVGYVFVSAERRDMNQMWRESSEMLALVAVIVLWLAFIVTYLTVRDQTNPIKQMTQIAHNFARGDFSSRVTITTGDEIGVLADSFNLMADSIESNEKRRAEFIANVSHELKTPMTTISGFADGIIDGTIPKEKEREYLTVISSETRRLSRLVRSMLDMSQLSAKDTTTIRNSSFDVSEILIETLLSLEKKITDKGLDVSIDIPEEHCHTLGDKDSINQVIYNLIDNAVKFSDGSGPLGIGIYAQGGKAYISISNTGPNIPEEELPFIFDRFHKTDKSRSMDKEGVGLGLYIVKTILDNHGEDIFVTSDNGNTKFTFTLTIANIK